MRASNRIAKWLMKGMYHIALFQKGVLYHQN